MLTITNPSTGAVLDNLPTDTAQTIREKYKKARQAQKLWCLRSYEERKEVMLNFSLSLQSSVEELAQTLTSEMGKPICQSRNEIKALPDRVQFFLDSTERLTLSQQVADGSTAEQITYEPLGVVANISAWNYPYFVGSNVFVPALLTGNGVLYKPSEFATLTGLKIASHLYKAGLPQDLFSVIIGAGDVGSLLLDLPIDGVFFTGSQKTGLSIAKNVSEKLIPLQLELGGKDPVYVMDDVDVATVAASVADGAFYNTGQSCCAVERIYVHKDVAQEFIKYFCATVKDFTVGDPLDEKTYIGPLARRVHVEFLQSQLDDAVAQGAKIQIGGQKGNGNYFSPTVLTGVTHEMQIMRDESFGPIIGIQIVESDEEAVVLMNDSCYGLTAGVYGKDKSRAMGILSKADAGTVYWNCCDRVSPRLPWTGRKHSGIGSTLSEIGIRSFMKPKAWHLRGL